MILWRGFINVNGVIFITGLLLQHFCLCLRFSCLGLSENSLPDYLSIFLLDELEGLQHVQSIVNSPLDVLEVHLLLLLFVDLLDA